MPIPSVSPPRPARSHVLKSALLLAFMGSGCARAQQAWVPVWADEFNGTSLNAADWEAQTGIGPGNDGWGNNELEYYTGRTSNVSVSGGLLTITARRENFSNRQYTSARLRTLGKHDFLYGKFEARMKVPAGQGMWPAFWMLPTNSPYGGWAASGEIDIMESINLATTVYGTIHFGGQYPNNTSNGGNRATNLSSDFHVYTMEWEPDEIRWYIDGVRYYRVTSGTWYSSAAPSNPRAPFDTPFHLLLNLAVGGNWPGNPDASTTFPATMQVDYVRVSQRPPKGPYSGSVPDVTTRIEAENYDLGGGSIAYSDTDPENTGGVYRPDEGVDIEACSEGGFNVGWFHSGEWMEYTVNVPVAGTYDLRLRGATPNTGAAFKLSVGGVDKTASLTVPPTSSWQSFTTVHSTVSLSAGVQSIRLTNSGSSDFNVNWMEFGSRGDTDGNGVVNIDDLYSLEDGTSLFPDVDGDGVGATAADQSTLIVSLRTGEKAQILTGP